MATKEKGKTHLYVLTLNFDCTYIFARKRDAMKCYRSMLRFEIDKFEKYIRILLNEKGEIKSSLKDERPPYAQKDKHWQTVHDTDNDLLKENWFTFNRSNCLSLEKIYLKNLSRKKLAMMILSSHSYIAKTEFIGSWDSESAVNQLSIAQELKDYLNETDDEVPF